MEILKKPIWRVPLVLGVTGIGLRFLTYIFAFISVQIQRASGPDPATGAYRITGGYVTEIMAVIGFLAFWGMGWKFVRGLERKDIFLSATIMVAWHTALLAAEQLSQAAGGYSMLVYRLWTTVEATGWVDQIMIRVFDQVSIPVMIPGLLVPYLYLLLAGTAHQPPAPSGEAL